MSELKQCTKCGRMLPLENFRWKDKSKGKKHSQCKECQSRQEKQRYQTDIIRKEQVLERAKTTKERNVEYINNKKSSYGCAKCGEKRYYVLDFHHKDPLQKKDNINNLRGCSYETIDKEIDKCIVLCSNCHREFHHLEFEIGITLEEYLGN